MRGSLSRRALISAVAWGVSMHLFGRKVAYGQATQASVPFSQDVAAHIARSLIAENPVLPTLEIGDPVPSYDANGAFKGYSIGFFDGGMPHGHVVFDVDCDGLVLQLSYSEGNRDPYSILASLGGDLVRQQGDAKRIVAFAPGLFGIPNDELRLIQLFDKGVDVDYSGADRFRSPGNDSWNDVLISYDDVYGGGYTTSKEQYAGDFYPISQRDAERAVRRYACGPHALAIVAATLPNGSGTNSIVPQPISDTVLRDGYNKLWEYTKTREINNSNGIAYGSTQAVELAPGFVRFCREKGTSILANHVSNPGFPTFLSHVNNGFLSIIGGGINTPSGESGHFMPVNGYAYLYRKSDKKVLQALSVYDGWNSNQFFNFDFPRFTWKGGTLIKHVK